MPERLIFLSLSRCPSYSLIFISFAAQTTSFLFSLQFLVIGGFCIYFQINCLVTTIIFFCSIGLKVSVFIVCNRYWVTEMHVDGFRFDLASIMTRGSRLLPYTPHSSLCLTSSFYLVLSLNFLVTFKTVFGMLSMYMGVELKMTF